MSNYCRTMRQLKNKLCFCFFLLITMVGQLSYADVSTEPNRDQVECVSSCGCSSSEDLNSKYVDGSFVFSSKPLVISIGSQPTIAIQEAAVSLKNILTKMLDVPIIISTASVMQASGQFNYIVLSMNRSLFSCSLIDDKTQLNEKIKLTTYKSVIEIIGNNDRAVKSAIWLFLNKIGYRQYFPGALWEVMPNLIGKNIYLSLSYVPLLKSRQIWPSYGVWSPIDEYNDWAEKNLLSVKSMYWSSHVYHKIIRENSLHFAKNEDWTGGEESDRDVKLCVSEEELQVTVINWAIDYFEENPEAVSVSLEPSDGDGWNEGCELDSKVGDGSPSDRAFFLANKVAIGLARYFKEPKLVTLLAYYKHAKPPSFPLHKNVYVTIANGYFEDAEFKELVSLWENRSSAGLGLYDYFCIEAKYNHLPGISRISKTAYLLDIAQVWSSDIFSSVSAQSCDSFALHGLNLYIAAQLMSRNKLVGSFNNEHSDIANLVDGITIEVLSELYGNAAIKMSEFYGTVNRKDKLQINSNSIRKLYQLLKSALAEVDSISIEAKRIKQIAIYVRYLNLYKIYKAAEGSERQVAFMELLAMTYRARDSHMIHSKSIWASLGVNDKNVSHPKSMNWNTDESIHPWKVHKTISDEELLSWINLVDLR